MNAPKVRTKHYARKTHRIELHRCIIAHAASKSGNALTGRNEENTRVVKCVCNVLVLSTSAIPGPSKTSRFPVPLLILYSSSLSFGHLPFFMVRRKVQHIYLEQVSQSVLDTKKLD